MGDSVVTGKKNLKYIKLVRDNDLVSTMRRAKLIADLSLFGVNVEYYSDLRAETLRIMYNAVIDDLIKKYHLE